MSHAATFDLSDELATLFQRECTGEGKLACVQVAIEDEKFPVANTIPLGTSAEVDFEAAKRLLSEDAAAYLLFRLLRGEEKQPWALMSFVPDTAPVKQKMLYANAKDTLRKKLPGDSFGQESHWSAMDEVMMGGAAALSGVDVQHVMTEAERMVLHEDMSSAAEAAAGKARPAPRAPMRARDRFWHRAPPPSLPAPSHPAPTPLFSRCACAGNRLHSSRRARPPGR